MKVILQKDVLNLGDAGDIREVPNGYARNFLIPRKLVMPARGDSVKAAEHQKKIMSLRVEKRNKDMAALSEKINALGSVEIKVRVGQKNKMFGSVTSVQIAQALKDAGFVIDRRKIDLNDAIRMTGKFPVKIRLAEKITSNITVNVVADENFPVEEEPEIISAPQEASESSEEESDADEEAADTEDSDTDRAGE